MIGKPQCGNHNNLYNVNKIFDEMISSLDEVSISMGGVFLWMKMQGLIVKVLIEFAIKKELII